MKEIWIAVFGIASAAGAQITPQSKAPVAIPETATDETVISLVKAGLGPEAIIAKINSSAGSYDTSTASLIKLKQAGVPDVVIAAMLNRSRTPVLASGVANNGSSDPLVPHSPGLYLLEQAAGGRMVRIDATVSNQMKTSGTLGFAFSYGLASMKMKTVIPNPYARVQTVEHRPTFYFYFDQAGPLASVSQFGGAFSPMATSPNEFSLVRFDQKSDHREAAVGSYSLSGMKSGVSDKARVTFTYEDVAPGVFKVTPTADLLPGQYGFVSSMGAGAGMGMMARIFDFGIN